jgi:hypothetical protein
MGVAICVELSAIVVVVAVAVAVAAVVAVELGTKRPGSEYH